LRDGANEFLMPQTQKKRIVIGTGMLFDGRYVSRDTRIVVEGSKIASLDPKAAS
jgi:hypothetical protein